MHVGAAAGMLGGVGNMAYALLSPLIGRLADLHQSGYDISSDGSLALAGVRHHLPVARRSSHFAGIEVKDAYALQSVPRNLSRGSRCSIETTMWMKSYGRSIGTGSSGREWTDW